MRKHGLIVAMVAVAVVMSMSGEAWATYHFSTASGNWSDGANWTDGAPVAWDDADISHTITFDLASLQMGGTTVRGGGELILNGDLSTWYPLDVQGTVSGTGTVTVGPGDGMGLYGGGVITANFNAIRFNVWMNGQQFAMAHGTSGFFNWLGGANNTINISQQAGQTDGVSLGALTLPDGNKLNLTFDAGSGAGDWILKVAEASDSLSALVTGGSIAVSGAAYEIVNDGSYTTIQAKDIPEPATMALLAIGGLAALIRRKRS